MKNWKIVLVAILVSISANVSKADESEVKIPEGWVSHGSLGKTYKTGFSAPEIDECTTACFMLVGPDKSDRVSDDEFGAITKTVNVGHLQNQEMLVAFRYSQEGKLESKDVWIRFFDEKNEIAKQRLRLTEQANDRFVSAKMNFLVPASAVKMELGFGMSGYGRFEFGDLRLAVYPASHSISGRINAEMNALAVDPLTLSVDR